MAKFTIAELKEVTTQHFQPRLDYGAVAPEARTAMYALERYNSQCPECEPPEWPL